MCRHFSQEETILRKAASRRIYLFTWSLVFSRTLAFVSLFLSPLSLFSFLSLSLSLSSTFVFLSTSSFPFSSVLHFVSLFRSYFSRHSRFHFTLVARLKEPSKTRGNEERATVAEHARRRWSPGDNFSRESAKRETKRNGKRAVAKRNGTKRHAVDEGTVCSIQRSSGWYQLPTLLARQWLVENRTRAFETD